MKSLIPIAFFLSIYFFFSCGNRESSKEKIEYDPYAQMKSEEFFKNKATQAKKDAKWGWINPYGEWVIPPEYDERPKQWIQGWTVMKKGEKYGILSSKNEVIHPFEYDQIYLNDGKAWPGIGPFITFVKGEETEMQTFEGEPIDSLAKCQVTNVSLVYGNDVNSYLPLVDFKVINGKGEVQLDFEQVPFTCWVGEFSDGMAPFFIGKYNGRSASGVDGLTYYGYLNESGEMVVEPQFVANYMMMNTEYWRADNPNFRFVNGEALVKAEDHYFAINKKGEYLRDYAKEYYRISLPDNQGLRKADRDFLDAEGNLVYHDESSNWDMIGDFNNQGFAVQKNYDEKRYRVVSHLNEEIFSLPFQDENYFYEVSPFWLDENRYFVVNRASISKLESVGVDRFYDAPAEMRELKYVDFDLSETDWMPFNPGWIPNIGRIERVNKETSALEITDLEDQLIFSCDSCYVRFPGSDQVNNKEQWLFLVRYENGQYKYLGINGFDFTNELEIFEMKFTDIDASAFKEPETNENPNFILHFNEEDVDRYYSQLLPPKN